jgi:HlyD family secretion protein
MRKLFIVVIVLAVLGAAGYFGYREFQKRQAEAAAPNYEAVTVKRGDISATVSATGTVLPEREVSVAFPVAGTIADVNVEVGQAVKAGDTLATLDATDLDLAEKQAQVGVKQAQAQLQQLLEGANTVDVVAAQAALASAQEGLKSAQAAYQQTLKGPDKDTLASAQAQVGQARVQLEQAQQAYDKVKDRPDVGLMPQSIQLQNASIALETAEAQYRAAEKSVTNAQIAAARAQVTAAEAQVAQGQANLDQLKRGTSEGQLAVARAGVDQAMLSLQVAQRRLENARLLAPWDGVITEVAVVEGGQTSPAQPAVKLADTTRFHLDVQVDEIDIAGLRAGQPVQVEIDALPDEKLTGTVSLISPAATTTSTGGVSYNVRLDIGPTNAPLKGGMSATATIIASTRPNVLLVPNRAVQLERETGKTFVERVVGADLVRTEVQLGLRDEQFSEVREGLSEGETLAIRNRSGQEQLRSLFTGGG